MLAAIFKSCLKVWISPIIGFILVHSLDIKDMVALGVGIITSISTLMVAVATVKTKRAESKLFELKIVEYEKKHKTDKNVSSESDVAA